MRSRSAQTHHQAEPGRMRRTQANPAFSARNATDRQNQHIDKNIRAEAEECVPVAICPNVGTIGLYHCLHCRTLLNGPQSRAPAGTTWYQKSHYRIVSLLLIIRSFAEDPVKANAASSIRGHRNEQTHASAFTRESESHAGSDEADVTSRCVCWKFHKYWRLYWRHW